MLTRQRKQLAVGETVMIYVDPLTEKRPEGEAIVIRINALRDNVAWCRVRFDGEEEIYARQIRLYTLEELQARQNDSG